MQMVKIMEANEADPAKKRELKKKIEKMTKMQKGKYDTKKSLKKASGDFTKYMPVIVLWLSRVFMFFISYMYHSEVSMVNVFWIVMTFILPMSATFFLSILVMLPLLSWEFIFIYGIRIPVVQDLYFMKRYGSYFDWKMRLGVTEQTLLFLTLSLFFMMISCSMLTFNQSKENALIKFFKKRINDPRFSNSWKVIFFSTRYI